LVNAREDPFGPQSGRRGGDRQEGAGLALVPPQGLFLNLLTLDSPKSKSKSARRFPTVVVYFSLGREKKTPFGGFLKEFRAHVRLGRSTGRVFWYAVAEKSEKAA
jgi:hypothetical protein